MKLRIFTVISAIVATFVISFGLFFVQRQHNTRLKTSTKQGIPCDPINPIPGCEGGPPTFIIPDTPTPAPSAGPVTPTPVAEIDPEDIDRNGCIGILDFNAWFQSFKTGRARSGTNPDVNSDGSINLLDFNLWFKAMVTFPKSKLC